jgi:hypothetical protein
MANRINPAKFYVKTFVQVVKDHIIVNAFIALSFMIQIIFIRFELH